MARAKDLEISKLTADVIGFVEVVGKLELEAGEATKTSEAAHHHIEELTSTIQDKQLSFDSAIASCSVSTGYLGAQVANLTESVSNFKELGDAREAELAASRDVEQAALAKIDELEERLREVEEELISTEIRADRLDDIVHVLQEKVSTPLFTTSNRRA